MKKINKEAAKKAVKTLLEYIGEKTNREGLKETPERVVNSYSEFFSGYSKNPTKILSKTFEEVSGYNEMILLKNIRLESFCEHHLLPILGKVHVAYLPKSKIVGISKIAKVVDVFSKRLQLQERLTAEIAHAIQDSLDPRGVAVYIDSIHHCMTTRGAHKSSASMITSFKLGVFKENYNYYSEFISLINSS